MTSVEDLCYSNNFFSDRSYPYTFNGVFHPDSSREDVFCEISEVVQSALDGFKVMVTCYVLKIASTIQP